MAQISSRQLESPLNTTGSLYGTSSWSERAITASYAENAGNAVTYVNNLSPLTGIQVEDYSTSVSVVFTNGTLKFIFGTPVPPSNLSLTFNTTFEENRFNQVQDTYDVSGSFSVGAYTLISASLYTGSVLLDKIGSGTTIRTQLTTSGSQYYRLEVTSSNPSDGSISTLSTTLSGILNKLPPGNPTITPTTNIQLGTTNDEIEQGATGSITFVSSSGTSGGWSLNYVISSYFSPLTVTGSLTGSNNIIISVTGSYTSVNNIPTISTSSFNSVTYTKIRSLRYGASESGSFTPSELADLALWTGSIGPIEKGINSTTEINNKVINITWVGSKFHYIIYSNSLPNLKAITAGGIDVLPSDFTLTTVGDANKGYKVYKSNTKKVSNTTAPGVYTEKTQTFTLTI